MVDGGVYISVGLAAAVVVVYRHIGSRGGSATSQNPWGMPRDTLT